MQLVPAQCAGTPNHYDRPEIRCSAAATSLNDHIAVRELCTHTHCSAFCMMPPPAVVMIAVHVLANHDIVTIADDNLRGYRNGARKHPTNGRT